MVQTATSEEEGKKMKTLLLIGIVGFLCSGCMFAVGIGLAALDEIGKPHCQDGSRAVGNPPRCPVSEDLRHGIWGDAHVATPSAADQEIWQLRQDIWEE